MSDISSIQDSYKSHLFKIACQDVARVVSILSLESANITRTKKTVTTTIYEKFMFFLRFFYLVFFKGFTPTVFDMIPYRLWQILTISIYFYRLTVLPLWLRIIGYGKYASWTEPKLGSAQPSPSDPVCHPYKLKTSLIAEERLSQQDFGDFHFENLVQVLYKREAHLSPHSQSPGHPFVSGFPGNFMDHLLGVYKILIAWGQPQYVARAGMFHSLYGTYDYRASFFDLIKGRDELRGIIGPAAEEIAFVICTSDRIGLMSELLTVLYGKNTKSAFGGGIAKDIDGNPYPPRVKQTLSASGFPLRNHITQKIHIIPPDLFAQFVIVMTADFLEQGALGLGSEDADICLFQYLRYRFFSDLLVYVAPYLRVLPKVWFAYMCENTFVEPFRDEIILIKRLWVQQICPLFKNISSNIRDPIINLNELELNQLAQISTKCPYLVEPRVILACGLGAEQSIKDFNRKILVSSALQLICDWGMLSIKGTCSIGDVIRLLRTIQE